MDKKNRKAMDSLINELLADEEFVKGLQPSIDFLKELHEKLENEWCSVRWYRDYDYGGELGIRTRKQLCDEIEDRILKKGMELERTTTKMWLVKDKGGSIVRTYYITPIDGDGDE